MQKRIRAGWILLLLLMISLALSACVRPYPGSEASAAPPVVNPIATQPVVIPEIPIATVDPGTEGPDTEPAEPVEIQEPTPVVIEPAPEQASETTHTILAGDTLFKIALEYDVTVDEIAAANALEDVNSLEVGQILIIPLPGSTVTINGETAESEPTEQVETESETAPEAEPTRPATAVGGVHIVQPGDNLFRIGLQYGCSVEQLAQHNGITTPNRISVGMEIQIPECN